MDLAERAQLWGVSTHYENFNHERRDAPPETVDAILETMGAEGGEPPAATAVVAKVGDAIPLEGVVEVVAEDGGSEQIDGSLPTDLGPGYHRLVSREGSERTLILSPGTCFLDPAMKVWGWALQLYSLRSADSWGIGDLGDLGRFASWARETGGKAIMLNPLHAAMPLAGQQPSPYFPSSRCFRNPLYLDVAKVAASRAVDVADITAQGRALSKTTSIDRDAAYRCKMQALEEIFSHSSDPAFETFLLDRGDLLWSYATYAALAEEHQSGPSDWSAELQRADSEAVTEWRAAHLERVRFHAWMQWLLEEQLAEASEASGIVHDLAIGVDPEGADAWLWRDVFTTGVTVGAPPDEFNLRGQNWGLPPMDPWKLRSSGYEPFIETIRSGMRFSSGIRIDHVMGLFRLYWIPDGMEPDRGTYVRYPSSDLLNIVALESHRAGAYVIGEDLGTVEDVVREEMEARSMLSYKLLWFEEEPPATYPKLALAAVENHDVPTIAGMWTGRDIEVQEEAGQEVNVEGTEEQLERLRGWLDLDEDAPVSDVVEKAYELLAEAPSQVVMATLEDALEVEERPNLPGTTEERPNWSIPLPLTLEEIIDDPRPRKLAEVLSRPTTPKTGSSQS